MIASINRAFPGSRGKKTVCKTRARKVAVQTLCKQNSPRNLCKLVQMYSDRLNACISVWFGRGASRLSAGERAASGNTIALLSFYDCPPRW